MDSAKIGAQINCLGNLCIIKKFQAMVLARKFTERMECMGVYCFVKCGVLIALMSSFSLLPAAELVHPGLLHSKQDLDFVKSKIAQKAQPWTKALTELKKLSPENRKPHFQARLTGQSNFPPMDNMTRDGAAAYACALIWYYTGEKKYADNAIRLLNAWSGFQSSDNWLFLSWAVPQFLNAAEIMRYTPGSGWSQTDIGKFTAMVRNRFLPAMQNKTWVNNAMHSTIEGQIACAIYLDDKAELTRAVRRWREWTPTYFYLKSDGSKPLTLGRMSWASGPYYEGQNYETCRDLNHARLGTRSIFFSAEMAWNQGVDLWEEQQRRFAAFTELHAGWLSGDTKYPSDICGGNKVWCAGGVSWSSKRGHPPDCDVEPWDIVLNQIQTRLGIPLPRTQKITEQHRPLFQISRRNNKYQSLTHANLNLKATVSVTITSPENNATFQEPADITITAQASTEEGSITKVEFFNGSTKLGESTSSPHTYTWSDVPGGNYSISAKATDSHSNSGTASVTVVVSEQKGPFTGEPVALPGTVMAVEYDKGGEGVSYFDTTPQNRGAEQRGVEFRPDESVDIDNHPDGGYVIGWIADGEWVEYTVSVARAGEYELEFHTSSLNGGGSIGLDVDGETLLGGVTVPQNNDWHSYTTFTEKVTLNAGEQVWRVNMENGGFNLYKIVVEPEGSTRLGHNTASVQSAQLSLLPATADSRLFYLSREADWNIYSLQGVKLSSGRGDVIDMSAVSRGVYMITFEGITKRLVLR